MLLRVYGDVESNRKSPREVSGLRHGNEKENLLGPRCVKENVIDQPMMLCASERRAPVPAGIFSALLPDHDSELGVPVENPVPANDDPGKILGETPV